MPQSPAEAWPFQLSEEFRQARILIVDDEPANIELLKRQLEWSGCVRLESTTDPRQAEQLYLRIRPDLILLDLHMPHMNGLAVMDRLYQLAEEMYLPILMLTGDLTPEARREALSRGAKDFVTKPFQRDEVLLRIRTLLQTRFLYRRIEEQNQDLDRRVQERTRELEERTRELQLAQSEVIERLARAAEFRDGKTGQHIQRVGDIAKEIAQEIGLPNDTVDLIRLAAPLHDIGKIGIPDRILLKRGKLTGQEFAQVRTHTTIGARILSDGRFPLLRMAEEIARSHHEHWDGGGYEEGLSGEQIPLSGRIVAIADVYDALLNERPYKPAWPVAEAVAEIRRQRGRQFEPRLVDAFLQVIQRIGPDA